MLSNLTVYMIINHPISITEFLVIERCAISGFQFQHIFGFDWFVNYILCYCILTLPASYSINSGRKRWIQLYGMVWTMFHSVIPYSSGPSVVVGFVGMTECLFIIYTVRQFILVMSYIWFLWIMFVSISELNDMDRIVFEIIQKHK